MVRVPIVFELFFWLLFLNSWNFTHTTYIIHSFKQKMNNIGIVFHLHIYKKTARQRSERNRVCARERVVQGTWYCTIVVYIPRTHTEGTCHVSRGTGVPHRVDICSKFKIDNGTWNMELTDKVHTRLLQDCRQYFYYYFFSKSNTCTKSTFKKADQLRPGK